MPQVNSPAVKPEPKKRGRGGAAAAKNTLAAKVCHKGWLE